MKCELLSADFEANTITLIVPIAVNGKRLHYHPCLVEVDLSEFLDDHEPILARAAPKEESR